MKNVMLAMLAVVGLAAAAQAVELTATEKHLYKLLDSTDDRGRYSEAPGPIEIMVARCQGKTYDAKINGKTLVISCAGLVAPAPAPAAGQAAPAQPAAPVVDWSRDFDTGELIELGYIISPDGASLISIKHSLNDPATAAITLDSLKAAMASLAQKAAGLN